MFKNLSNKILQSIRNIIHSGRLTENNIKDTLNMIQVSLLEGDVALPVVRDFTDQVKKSILGKDISKHLSPGQEFIKVMHSALVKIMGTNADTLNLCDQNPTILLIVGTQGAGKTTTTGKLARFLKVKKNKKVLVSSTDIYRPAGLKQLQTLIYPENINFFINDTNNNQTINTVKNALAYAKSQYYDVLLIDTPGCLDTDNSSLSDLSEIHKVVNPIEVLFVIDSMMGQVSLNNINVFNNILPLTGVILTKLDGDSRGGVALSVKFITGKPIKFIGTGEKIDELEPFYPDRIAGRILGMGDVLSLIESIQNQEIQDKANKYTTKKNIDFNLYDFLNHIKKIQKIGGIDKIISKLPNLGVQSDKIQSHIHSNMFIRMEAIINSMTIKERMHPDIITGSRKKRIANGSGVNIQDVNKLLDKFNHLRIMMRQINKNGILKMVRTLQNKISSNFTIR